jgi:hypothetical protein
VSLRQSIKLASSHGAIEQTDARILTTMSPRKQSTSNDTSEYDTEHPSAVDGTYIVSTKNVTDVDYAIAHLEKPDTNIVRNLKTTADGAIILIPQPSDDPEDPLNVTFLCLFLD